MLNYFRRIETFLHQKFLSAKNAFEVREVEKIQKRLFQLKKINPKKAFSVYGYGEHRYILKKNI